MRIKITADHTLVRKLNTITILQMLRTAAPISRAELAKQSGLNRSTVSSIINTLIEHEFVAEMTLQKDKVGRPGMSLTLNPNGGGAVGVEIGVDFISVLLSDLTAQPQWQLRKNIPANTSQADHLQQAETMVSVALSKTKQLNLPVFGIGIGVPGLVDVQSGTLKFAPNLQWRDVPLRSLWENTFQLPVIVENEANAAAQGEYYFGAAQQVENFIYLSAGVGLGGGIFIGGVLYRGSGGYAGEIGHMTVDIDGEICSCGRRGCWETLVGPRAVEKRFRAILQQEAKSVFPGVAAEKMDHISFDQIVDAARMGDVVAETAVHKVAVSLGIGIANLVNVFNPKLIVLGGRLRLASNLLTPTIEKTVQENSLHQSLETLKFANSAHGSEACVMGAVALVLDNTLNEPNF